MKVCCINTEKTKILLSLQKKGCWLYRTISKHFFILFSKRFDLCQFTVRQTEMQKFNALILHRSGRPTKNTLRVSGITVWDVTKEHIETPEFLSHIG